MNFRNIKLVLKREYLQRVRNPGFIIGTIAGALMLAGLAFVPTLLSLLDRESALKVAVVDPNNIVYRYMPQPVSPTPTPVSSSNASPTGIPVGVPPVFSKADTEDEAELTARVNKGEIDGYLVVKGDRPSNVTFSYHGKDRPSTLVGAQMNAILSAALVQGKLQEFGIPPEQAQSLFTPPTVNVEPLVGGTLKNEREVFQATALVYFLLILLYVTILMYGIQVAMGVVEEKSTRVMEMLITAIRPIDLLLGKVLGVGLAGLTQYGLWVITGLLGLLISGFLSGAASSAGLDIASVPAPTLFAFLIFFLLGYLLYAAMYAALGSLVAKVEDVNNITTPLTLVMVAVYLVSFSGLAAPDAPHIRWLSFVPFFTPMLMFIRVALGNVALWEFLLSVVLLALASYLLTWLAAKIYRVGVLLYGKRPSIREITRLMRAA